MSTRLSTTFVTAVRYATATVFEIADGAGYKGNTFSVYLNGRRPASRAAALAVADALEVRGRHLIAHAQKLREVAHGGDADAASTPKRGNPRDR